MRDELKIARDDICILSAEKKSENGTFKINEKIRAHYGYNVLTPGEPVMCVENHTADSEELILNGWTGEIVSCAPRGNVWVLTLAFPAFGVNSVEYEIKNNAYLPDEFVFGYAGTVHKYQGSEAPYVIAVIGDSFMTTRALLYTAFSRAKEKLIVLGNLSKIPDVLERKMPHRLTWLSAQNFEGDDLRDIEIKPDDSPEAET
jgi:exodeoxyribonuclease V alpha subunit